MVTAASVGGGTGQSETAQGKAVHSEPLGRGSTDHLGVQLTATGINLCLYAKHASRVEVLFFDQAEAQRPTRTVVLDAGHHRTYHYWHAEIAGIGAGALYGFRVYGPWQPEVGLRFDPRNLLLDPYGLGVVRPAGYGRSPGRSGLGDLASSMKSVVVDPHDYDWQGDRPLRRPRRETVIYELHVRGFTCDPSSGLPPERAGTYAGLMDKIPYLVDLGVTAVELLPVLAFDPLTAPAGRTNYWGYAPVSLFAPHPDYSAAYRQSGDPLAVIHEFRDLVKALHRAGIEVILDVVYNHTAEGDHHGPSFCFRGLANEAYYLLERDGHYCNYSGCGNTLNANHPMLRRLIRHSLRYWVKHMHVDGFRFDLASVLSRDEEGRPMPLPPVLWDIETDPLLAGTKLIAEAWDAAGLYQVGSFIGDSWQEWNGRFRDDIRRFLRGDPGQVPRAAMRLLGSPDIYGHENREPEQSVNFIACHDGFTLADLVAYNHKHNESNGEANRDGNDDNASWNCGVEGPTDDGAVLELRQRQIRNFLTLLLLSIGTPMLSMGDEVCRSQGGNNNPYCHDDPTSWFDWGLVERHADVLRFTRELIYHRLRSDVLVKDLQLSLNELIKACRISWHGTEPHRPDWSEASRSLALGISGVQGRFRLQVMVNAYWEPLRFHLPPADGSALGWRRWIDTALPPPHDIVKWSAALTIPSCHVTVAPRSLQVLVAIHAETDTSSTVANTPVAGTKGAAG